MSEASDQRAREFLAIADQFKLGVLLTESSHPVTANLSEVARRSVEDALGLLFRVDLDVLRRYRRWVAEGSTQPIAEAVLAALRRGGRVFFTGCGSTGRLSILLESIWRRFWASLGASGAITAAEAAHMADRAFSAMAGGDFALIKAVEGFEDFTQFGRRQMADLGIRPGDVLFAITEGGETSWVIGTAWEGLERGATVYFVYNNPDELLERHVQRSREVIQEPRIHKVNLTTGPMAITGSTRMQATTIQLCVLLTILEYVVRTLVRDIAPAAKVEQHIPAHVLRPPETAPADFLAELERAMAQLRSRRTRADIAAVVRLEENAYRSGHRSTYFARGFAVDVLTDTTERSPTFCTPPFRRFDDTTAAESWTFLTVPVEKTEDAWHFLLQRSPRCVQWPEELVRAMVPADKADRTVEVTKRIGIADLMKFRIGLDGLPYRRLGEGDVAVAIGSPADDDALSDDGPLAHLLCDAKADGASAALIALRWARQRANTCTPPCEPDARVSLGLPRTTLLLHGVAHATIKMLLNALSTCTMVRLGRVMGNYMVWVVASNLKLIDRATRYISRLTDLEYEEACRLLFDSIEYVTPRMQADQAYPPVVGLSVLRARYNVTAEEAERRLWAQLGMSPHAESRTT